MSALTTDVCNVVNPEETSKREDTNTEVVNEINPNDIECRACLQKFSYQAGLIDLFQAWAAPWEGMGNTVAEDLAKLANIEISITDVFSKHICQLCYQKLLDACTFSTSVHNNDLVLRTNKNDFSKVWPKPIVIDNPILKSAMQVEIKQEPLSDNEADDLTECMESNINMQTDFTNFEIKVEPEEIIQPQPIKITVNDPQCFVETELKICSHSVLREGQGNNGGMVSDESSSKNIIDEMIERRKLQNIIRCKRYRENKKKKCDAIDSSITAEEAERMKNRKEYDRLKSKRYRDKKRAANVIDLSKP